MERGGRAVRAVFEVVDSTYPGVQGRSAGRGYPGPHMGTPPYLDNHGCQRHQTTSIEAPEAVGVQRSRLGRCAGRLKKSEIEIQNGLPGRSARAMGKSTTMARTKMGLGALDASPLADSSSICRWWVGAFLEAGDWILYGKIGYMVGSVPRKRAPSLWIAPLHSTASLLSNGMYIFPQDCLGKEECAVPNGEPTLYFVSRGDSLGGGRSHEWWTNTSR
jgi:hypothetical protein